MRILRHISRKIRLAKPQHSNTYPMRKYEYTAHYGRVIKTGTVKAKNSLDARKMVKEKFGKADNISVIPYVMVSK